MDHGDRLNLLLTAMADAGLDRIIGFSNAAHHVDFGDAVAMMSGFKPLGASFCVLESNGDARLMLSPAWDLGRAVATSRISTIAATDDLLASFEDIFKGNADVRRTGVVDLGKMPHLFAAGVKAVLGGTPWPAEDLAFGAAARKTDDEIENARRATEIAEKTYDYLLAIAEPGMPECYLAAELKNHSRSLGADDNFMMFHAEGHPLAVQPSSERRLERGDLILAEITPSHGGQFAQICRTACLGEPTDEQRDKYDLVVRAMKNGIAQAKPGSPMKAICQGVDEILIDEGYADYCKPPYMNRRGHGLGITSVRPGNVAFSNETILEDAMFFVVHPNQYIPEVGYLLCGEPIIIRDPSADVLTQKFAVLGAIDI